MYPESKCQPIQGQRQHEFIYSCHYNCSAWDKYYQCGVILLKLLPYFMNHIAENKSYFGLFLSQKHHSLSWGKQRQKTSSQPSKAVDHVLYVPHINILCTVVCTQTTFQYTQQRNILRDRAYILEEQEEYVCAKKTRTKRNFWG